MDQNTKIGKLKARGYDEDELNSMGLDQIDQLFKKEFPEYVEVADNAVQNQDFSKDKDTNANIYKLGPKPFAARKEFDRMEKDAVANRAANGNTDPTTKMDVDKSGLDKLKDWLGKNAVGGAPSEGAASSLPSISDTLPEQGDTGAQPAGNPVSAPTTAPTGTANTSAPANTNTASPSANEVKEAAKEDPRTNYQLKSIYQAYKDGDIDGNTAQYLAMDVLANFAKDLGAGQMAVANIYANGGNVVSPQHSKTMWDKRNEEMMKQGISAEAATVNNSDKQMERMGQKLGIDAQKLDNARKKFQNMPAEMFLREINRKDANGKDVFGPQEKALYTLIAAQSAGSDIGPEEYIATIGVHNPELAKNASELLSNLAGAAGGMAKGVNKGLNLFGIGGN